MNEAREPVLEKCPGCGYILDPENHNCLRCGYEPCQFCDAETATTKEDRG